MAGSKVSNFAIGDSNIQSVMLTLDKTFKGLHQVSLTNYDTTAESQVAAGSVIEIGGALYKFDSNESITGTPSDGTVYIMAVPSGDSVTCAYTNTAPTWSDSKQGWYGTGATANNRYLEFTLAKNGTLWTKSRFLETVMFAGQNSSTITFVSGEYTVIDEASYDNVSQWDSTKKCFKPFASGLYEINFSSVVLLSGTGNTVFRMREGGTGTGDPTIIQMTSAGAGADDAAVISTNRVVSLSSDKEYYFRIARGGTNQAIAYSGDINVIVKKIK